LSTTTMLKMAIPTDLLPCKATDKISFTIKFLAL
jgi:hypothetical protein